MLFELSYCSICFGRAAPNTYTQHNHTNPTQLFPKSCVWSFFFFFIKTKHLDILTPALRLHTKKNTTRKWSVNLKLFEITTSFKCYRFTSPMFLSIRTHSCLIWSWRGYVTLSIAWTKLASIHTFIFVNTADCVFRSLKCLNTKQKYPTNQKKWYRTRTRFPILTPSQ